MQIFLIGVNHRSAPVEVRERLAFDREQIVRFTAALRAEGVLDEAAVLSTCNRSEIYGVARNRPDVGSQLESALLKFHGQPPDELEKFLYRSSDRHAVSHLFRVASGLDSMLLGEAEVLGQVRGAYKLALESGATGPVLNRLFQSALEVGKRVRTQTELGARPMSVAFAGVKLAEQIFGKLRGGVTLLVGAGTVAEQVADHLRDRGIGRILVANRSTDHGARLARQVSGELLEWSSLERALEVPEVVITSVAASEPILTASVLERAMRARGNRTLFVIDLGVPRNVAPEAAQLYNLYLYNLDDLDAIVQRNLRARQDEIPRAEAIVVEHVRKFQMWHTSLEVVELARELREKVRQEREAILDERLLRLSHLSDEERREAAELLSAIVDRILRQPTAKGPDPRAVLLHSAHEMRKLMQLVEERP